MNDPPTLSHAHLAPHGHQGRSSSTSPTRQCTADDLLSNFTPRTAVEAFRNPSGTLKACIDAATPAEQAFAMRAALASKIIQEWLEDLSTWPWPAGGGPAGFETPVSKRRRPSRSEGGRADDELLHMDELYLGSLRATEVARYERRIDEISQDMEDLDVEEIKSQVLHNHIMPLSRPGSPILESNRSMTSSTLSSVAMMDDLTAMITATVMQTLPNLSKLSRLMNSWSLRLTVLRRIPVLLGSLADGEVALQSGWNAVQLGSQPDDRLPPGTTSSASLSRKDFDVMKSVLERKVAKAGRDLDAMLDTLEGWEDTLPEEWIDRMDALERGYGEWSAACERRIREADWAKIMQETTAPPTLAAVPGHDRHREANSSPDPVVPPKIDAFQPVTSTSASPTGTPRDSSDSEPTTPNDDTSQYAHGQSEMLTPIDTSPISKESTPIIKVHVPPEDPIEPYLSKGQQDDPLQSTPEEEHMLGHDGEFDSDELDEDASVALDVSQTDGAHVSNMFFHENAVDELEASELEDITHHHLERSDETTRSDKFDFDFDLEDPSEVDVPQPELPTLPRPRRGSDMSNTSTIIHGLQSGFMDFSSDQLDHGTPEIARHRDLEQEDSPSDDCSPPSSPPGFRSSTRSQSVSFNDTPSVMELPDFEDSPRTLLKSSPLLREDRDTGSPSKNSAASADDQLQQQISDILNSLPAKIRLTSEPSAINLNPPDFNMPTRKPPKQDHSVRSHSSLSTTSNMSSRAGTPAFTLAPAFTRNSRLRHQRGNQEIKLYHLSRSNGEPPIKLFIRCVGERGERVMVRVGGGWADLGEYLKEYASHHGRRSGGSGDGRVEIKDLPRVLTGRATSTPPSRPASAQDASSPVTPLHVRKSRRSVAGDDATGASVQPKTPLASVSQADSPSSEVSTRSRSSSRLSWAEEDSSLGMAGPRAKQITMSEESKAWVQSVKEKVRIASGERKVSSSEPPLLDGKFGEIGKVGATKRLFRRQ
ncbi:hypothetical protein B0H63DRAFT_247156 [Podospora didyma]|uniref:GAR domain-containing protein n=1 Tax=Podospora didyma TaxID=330526 RepID=A0AAE0NC96_9PEZI|nr:hypothetical protein B0H63DRAFT_247156 [Podospora didyma]